jgi:hypothetical protein
MICHYCGRYEGYPTWVVIEVWVCRFCMGFVA